MRPPEVPRLRDYLASETSARRAVSDGESRFDPLDLMEGTALAGRREELRGRNVLLAMRGQLAAAMAMLELDGVVRRLVVAPPDLKPDDRDAVIADADVEAIICDAPDAFPETARPCVPCTLPILPAARAPGATYDTEWILLTSGTTGRPKMVVHTLAALTGAVRLAPPHPETAVWSTFYDIRRYGGLQIFLRAVFGGGSLILGRTAEPLADHLARLGAEGVTHISGTPSHWRRVLMSQAVGAMTPHYVRLSGEIADQAVLDGLRQAYPRAGVGHAYASTEAGVGFDVNDGLEGFPVAFVERADAPVVMKVVDGSLRIRSARTASRYVGAASAPLMDADGFVDTGDMLERRGDRYHFVGRRGGIVNVGGLKVHPEEVEAALNSHPSVRMSLARARKNPFTGSIVVADVVLTAEAEASDALKADILERCRHVLDAHKVPVSIRFVPALDVTPTGKLSRAHA